MKRYCFDYEKPYNLPSKVTWRKFVRTRALSAPLVRCARVRRATAANRLRRLLFRVKNAY